MSSLQLPSCGNKQASMFEESAVFKIKDVPLVLSIFDQKTFYSGWFVQASYFDSDIGHYTCAIRLNNKFEMYDDMRAKPFSVSANENAVIHCLFYIKTGISVNLNRNPTNNGDKTNENHDNEATIYDAIDEEEFCGFDSSDSSVFVQHSDSSFFRLYHK